MLKYRQSSQIANGQYKDYLVGQLTRDRIIYLFALVLFWIGIGIGIGIFISNAKLGVCPLYYKDRTEDNEEQKSSTQFCKNCEEGLLLFMVLSW